MSRDIEESILELLQRIRERELRRKIEKPVVERPPPPPPPPPEKKPKKRVEKPLEKKIEKARRVSKKITEYASVIIDLDKREYNLAISGLTPDERKILKDLLNKHMLSFEVREGEAIFEAKERLIEEIEQELFQMKLPPTVDANKIVYFARRQISGYAEIYELLKDDEVEEIAINRPNAPIFIIHRKYGNLKTNLILSESQLHSLALRIATICGKRITYADPIIDGRLPTGDRVEMVFGKKYTEATTISVRKFIKEPLSLLDLIRLDTINCEIAAYLWLLVDLDANFMICGKPASGKTTFMNALLSLIPPEKRIITLESLPELKLSHENWLPLYYRDEESELQLFAEALRQRPDYFVIGEIRRPFEAVTWVQALSSGILGMTTMHSESTREVVRRLMSEPIRLSPTQIAGINVILTLKSYPEKARIYRRVFMIEEILGTDERGEHIINQPVYEYRSRFEKIYDSEVLVRLNKASPYPVNIEEELEERERFLSKLLAEKVDFMRFRRCVVEFTREHL
ncbi:hypothetical protein DRO02_05935 [archaeon]|nr:MAG: hypothetical protein DRO21_05730 [archaeon]RLG63776.1 MAG: hypothetical protein DRO02_05935 [archaeon]RLG66308.1 MAG: hypothetical protein DRN89_01210 [archaeon]